MKRVNNEKVFGDYNNDSLQCWAKESEQYLTGTKKSLNAGDNIWI